jgi:hypothetical protein
VTNTRLTKKKVHPMTDNFATRWLVRITVLSAFVVATPAQASNGPDGDFFAQPTWQPVTPESAYARLTEHLNSAGITPARQAEANELWRESEHRTQGDLLERLAQTLAKTDERVAELVARCAGIRQPGPLPEFAWLADSATPELVRNNMRLYLARWMVQQGYYDEALEWTEGLATKDVVAPEVLLFYRAVAHHHLVQPDKADAALGQLLQQEDKLPARFQKLAELMRQDLAGLQDESLDHIARRMADVRRRLALGRSGERVQGVENGVIASLDKLIKKAEDQLQQQQQRSQSPGNPGGAPSGTPMQDSQSAELKAPGEVERRNIGRGAGWGNLDDKDREKALQEIGREFPSHYREVIEEYFRRLAAEESADKP